MHNAFLVIRTLFLALLMYLQVLILVFASWNIASAKTSGMPAPGASVFLLTNSVLTFVLVPIAYLAEVICARARPARVGIECSWTALMSIFQLAASIAVTVNGPPTYCKMHSLWAMCASSSLLVHISWLVTLIILSYSLTLYITAATHAALLPDIWITPITFVPWFRPDVEATGPAVTSHAHTQKHMKKSSSTSTSSDASCAVSKYIADRWEKLSRAERQPISSSGPILFSRGAQPIDNARPAWARQQVTRRGIDSPFAMPLPKHKVPPVLLTPPPRIHSIQTVTPGHSHAVEVSEQLETGTHRYSTLTPRTSTVFPRTITDPDLPILRPSPSEWVRADHVYVEPSPSPLSEYPGTLNAV